MLLSKDSDRYSNKPEISCSLYFIFIQKIVMIYKRMLIEAWAPVLNSKNNIKGNILTASLLYFCRVRLCLNIYLRAHFKIKLTMCG